MDLIGSMASVLAITTRLREISKNIENAEFKNLLADLSMELADTKLKLADLIQENLVLKEKINTLSSVSLADKCPKCRKPSYELKDSVESSVFDGMGVYDRTYVCDSCGFSETKTVRAE